MLATIAASYGIVKTKLAEHERRTDAYEGRLLKLEQSVADRVARIETKVDLLLGAFIGDLQRRGQDEKER